MHIEYSAQCWIHVKAPQSLRYYIYVLSNVSQELKCQSSANWKWTEERMKPPFLPNFHSFIVLPPHLKCPLSYFAKGMNVNCLSVREVGHYSQLKGCDLAKTSPRRKQSPAQWRREPRGLYLRLMNHPKEKEYKQWLLKERHIFSYSEMWESWQHCSSCTWSPDHMGLYL